jgi:4-aminobutyrate aminotransferase-like enzyme/Ser/Thr protein kinase RdoA (MazF antagonist)
MNPASDTTEQMIRQFLEVSYDICGGIERLAGENDNYLVTSDDGTRYVLKLADENTSTGMIEIEHLAVERLVDAGLGVSLPRVVTTRTGDVQACMMTQNRQDIRGRLLTFVTGTAWCKDLPASAERFAHLGQTIARMNRAMAFVVHPETCRTHVWDLARADQHRKNIKIIQDLDRRQILEWVFHLFAAIAKPAFPGLPHSLIHGDINDDNILVEHGRVCGVLDFGDCLENPTVCDLAIALAYHTLDEDNPLEAAARVIGGYHQIRPLSEAELSVLFPLMCARLAVSVIISSKRREIDPHRESWFVSEERAWKNLDLFRTIGPAQAAIILAGQIDLEPYRDRGAGPGELVRERARVMAPCLSISYETPLKIIRGQGQYLYDYNGRPFLDFYNNVCHVGHCHPKVVEAGQRQMGILNTNTRYLYDGLTAYAQRLCETLPAPLDTCFFVNSGSEANELALRIARTITGRTDMLVVANAYHGHTNAMIDISPYKFMGSGGNGTPEPWVHVVPVADPYRGKYKGMEEDAGIAYGNEIGTVLDTLDRPPAGFISESLLSCGGQVIPPSGYFRTAFAHVRNRGGLCIVDEVQTGFGRVGTHFWGFEMQEVVPDIVVMGKPIGNGHPMSAVVTTREIADAFANGMEFFSTFGGNPVSCAIGMAVLDVIEEEGLQAHALAVGTHLLKGLGLLKDRHPIIGDVRGTGLFLGIELVKDRNTLQPAARKAAEVVNRMKNRGILLGTDGPFHNVIKIKPPMVVTRDDADMFVRVLDDILTVMEGAD